MAARRVPRFIRPRTIMYGAALSVVALVMLGAFLMRSTLDVTVLRDRAPLFVRLADGGIRNAYTVKIVNKTHDEAPLTLILEAPAGLRLTVQDVEAIGEGRYTLSLESFSGETRLGESPVESYARIIEARNGPTGATLVLEGGIEVPSAAITALRVPNQTAPTS
jgi:polyferredoxin